MYITLNYDFPLSEKALSSYPVVGDRLWVNSEELVHPKEAVTGYNDQPEYIEIDPFTGQIRTIRHN